MFYIVLCVCAVRLASRKYVDSKLGTYTTNGVEVRGSLRENYSDTNFSFIPIEGNGNWEHTAKALNYSCYGNVGFDNLNITIDNDITNAVVTLGMDLTDQEYYNLIDQDKLLLDSHATTIQLTIINDEIRHSIVYFYHQEIDGGYRDDKEILCEGDSAECKSIQNNYEPCHQRSLSFLFKKTNNLISVFSNHDSNVENFPSYYNAFVYNRIIVLDIAQLNNLTQLDVLGKTPNRIYSASAVDNNIREEIKKSWRIDIPIRYTYGKDKNENPIDHFTAGPLIKGTSCLLEFITYENYKYVNNSIKFTIDGEKTSENMSITAINTFCYKIIAVGDNKYDIQLILYTKDACHSNTWPRTTYECPRIGPDVIDYKLYEIIDITRLEMKHTVNPIRDDVTQLRNDLKLLDNETDYRLNETEKYNKEMLLEQMKLRGNDLDYMEIQFNEDIIRNHLFVVKGTYEFDGYKKTFFDIYDGSKFNKFDYFGLDGNRIGDTYEMYHDISVDTTYALTKNFWLATTNNVGGGTDLNKRELVRMSMSNKDPDNKWGTYKSIYDGWQQIKYSFNSFYKMKLPNEDNGIKRILIMLSDHIANLENEIYNLEERVRKLEGG